MLHRELQGPRCTRLIVVGVTVTGYLDGSVGIATML
jgi:hypothetical protein